MTNDVSVYDVILRSHVSSSETQFSLKFRILADIRVGTFCSNKSKIVSQNVAPGLTVT